MKARSFIIGIILSAIFLYLAFRKVDLGLVRQHLATADYRWLIPACLITIFALWLRAFRWGVLLAPLRKIPSGQLFSATSIGFMCNNLLPMRLGEFVRAYVLGRSAGVHASAALATIVVERLFDLFAMLAIFGILLIFAPFHNRSVKMSLLVALVFGLVVLGALLLYLLRAATFDAIARRLVPRRIRERAMGILSSFGSGLGVLRDPRRLLAVGALTLFMWFCITIVIEICFRATHLSAGGHLPPTAGLFVLVIIAIGVMVPSGPGFVGTLQAAAVVGLLVVGYTDKARALSFSIVYHATQWFPVVILGLIYLMKENLSLAQVGRITRPGDLEEQERP